MSLMVSRWPVLLTLPIGEGDVDDAGLLTAAAVERSFERARGDYLTRCSTVAATSIEVLDVKVQCGPGPVGAEPEVTVSTGVVEVYDDRFTMNARLRVAGEPSVVASAWCALSPGGPVTKAMRDEFIALAHEARHLH